MITLYRVKFLKGLRKTITPRTTRRVDVCQQRAIFPVRLQTSILATAELNFRVRNGNGWTLCVKVTDFK